MKKTLAAMAFFLLTGPASAQDLNLPPTPGQMNAQTQSQLNYQSQQTQLNNLQTQQSNLENQQRQQQLFNAAPPPAYMQNQYTPVTPTPRP